RRGARILRAAPDPMMRSVGVVIGVGAAGAAGALLRWGISAWIEHRFPGFPWGTLVVNVAGSFLLGIVFALLAERSAASPGLRVIVATGFLGAFTTFSTFSLDTVRLVQDGSIGPAAGNVAAGLALGLLGVWLGLSLGRAL
ncbi:MAG: fluoride efflux transporter CrcB, partial [Actinomycetota bacterium]